MPIRLGPEVCQDFEQAVTREWLVTNGLGGFASSTVPGANSRRYHGLLVAALRPPAQRVLLVAGLREWLVPPRGDPVPLSTHEFWDGTIFPEGFRGLDEFELDGMLPVFRWRIGTRILEKRIWMEERQNRTVITYQLAHGTRATLRLEPLCAYRALDEQRHGKTDFTVEPVTNGWRLRTDGLTGYVQTMPQPATTDQPEWHWRFLHRVERERGLDDEEDLYSPGILELSLPAGRPVALTMGTEPLPETWSMAASLAAARARQAAAWAAARIPPERSSELAAQLTVAAEQFRVVRVGRDGRPEPEQRTIIAGYPWFLDWGRDTMIGLPGIGLAAGKTEETRQILTTFLAYLDQGMLPNAFQNPGRETEYNTMDATLWLFQALQAYAEATDDWRFVLDQLPALGEVVHWHVAGTRHGIKMDARDGLLAGGESGFGLTWMDAKDADWVVTPRQGKPVEVTALWYDALRLMADWRRRAGLVHRHYLEMAQRAYTSARRFWYAAGGYLYDVIDGPKGDDASLRPNQLIALSLPFPLFEGDPAKAVLDVVERRLLTPFGLRTLSPDDPGYRPAYRGDHRARDGAYQMGIVWPWLLGPFLDAHLRVHHDISVVGRTLAPFRQHLCEAGLGTVSEIFEAEPPYRPVGASSQAWSVGELLRHAIALGTG
jgi:predicted glycogen debranching enzyme